MCCQPLALAAATLFSTLKQQQCLHKRHQIRNHIVAAQAHHYVAVSQTHSQPALQPQSLPCGNLLPQLTASCHYHLSTKQERKGKRFWHQLHHHQHQHQHQCYHAFINVCNQCAALAASQLVSLWQTDHHHHQPPVQGLPLATQTHTHTGWRSSHGCTLQCVQ